MAHRRGYEGNRRKQPMTSVISAGCLPGDRTDKGSQAGRKLLMVVQVLERTRSILDPRPSVTIGVVDVGE